MTVDERPPPLINLAELVHGWLADVTYKPGWSFEVRTSGIATIGYDGGQLRAFPPQVQLLVHATVPDSNSPEETIPTTHTFAVDPHLRTPESFYDWLTYAVSAVERHEMREFFRVGGVRHWDPHADPNDLYR